ncbi:hypothetical protein FPQ18DRAFT_414468 [Pyronema domesticum]|uniref:Uncharacterized protein n=1 Tax=Pyronema omphalodes (strain CBS 100304) TaxID=1076935 RepID=U4LD66_PYROM|nr:hypothetical protein FPQ18DRAFT_414468 [Pyronema domesticum]CCX29788.1 Protein of unknown function [Pyronema omphalodes CBS 100304]
MFTKHNGVDVMQAVQVGEEEKKSSSWGGGIWNGTANDTIGIHNGTDIRVNGTGIVWLNSTDTGEEEGMGVTQLPVGTDSMDEMGAGNAMGEGNGTDKMDAANDKKVVHTTVVVNATTSFNSTIAGYGMERNTTVAALQTGESNSPAGGSEGGEKGTKVVYAMEVVTATMPGNGVQAGDSMGANPTVLPPGESLTVGDGPAPTGSPGSPGSPGGTGGDSKTKVVYATMVVNTTASMAANGAAPVDVAISGNSVEEPNPTASLNVATPTTDMGGASMTIGGGPVILENGTPTQSSMGENGTGGNGAATTDAPGFPVPPVSPGEAKTAVQYVTVVVNATVPVNGNAAANGAQEVSGTPTVSGANTVVTVTTVPDGNPAVNSAPEASSIPAVNGAIEGGGAVEFAQNGAMVGGGTTGNGAVAGNTGEPAKNAPLGGAGGGGSNETPSPGPTGGAGAQNEGNVGDGAQNPAAPQTTMVGADVDVPMDSTIGQLELGNGVEFTVME